MKTVQVYLNSIQKVNSFSHELEQFDNDFDLVSGRYIVDAKSVMGIFSLDLNEPTSTQLILRWVLFWKRSSLIL